MISENEESDGISIKKDVNQGCILFPILFNIYFESIFRKASNKDDGIIVRAGRMSDIRYAVDSVLSAQRFDNLQDMLSPVTQISVIYGLNITTSIKSN